MTRDMLLLMIAAPISSFWIIVSSMLGLWDKAPAAVTVILALLMGFKLICLITYQRLKDTQCDTKEDLE